RWYLITIGDGFNFHTLYWHGNAVTTGGETTDVVAISLAQMGTADMVPDKAGMWMFHCHASDHMAAGMMTHYQVLPRAFLSQVEVSFPRELPRTQPNTGSLGLFAHFKACCRIILLILIDAMDRNPIRRDGQT